MTIPEVIGQLRQVKEHLDRARAAIRQALVELGKAEALLRYTLGNIRDKSIYAVPAQVKQHLTDADQGVEQTDRKVDVWLGKIAGASPGK